jgi:hypothetical protein
MESRTRIMHEKSTKIMALKSDFFTFNTAQISRQLLKLGILTKSMYLCPLAYTNRYTQFGPSGAHHAGANGFVNGERTANPGFRAILYSQVSEASAMEHRGFGHVGVSL